MSNALHLPPTVGGTGSIPCIHVEYSSKQATHCATLSRSRRVEPPSAPARVADFIRLPVRPSATTRLYLLPFGIR